ncbi:MAG: hypothetical protein ACO3JL_09945 [Myxococcota bacterium]
MTRSALLVTLPLLLALPALAADKFVPVAAWSGRLILPSLDERRDDGGVFFEVENAPDDASALQGQRLWLRYEDAPALDERVRRLRVDVAFNKAVLQHMAKGAVHPERINGWRQVSPLESLAGARPLDDVTVFLVEPHLDRAKGELRIRQDPVQTTGTHKALVRFIRRTAQGFIVQHYDRSRRSFYNGVEEEILHTLRPAPTTSSAPLTSLDGIEGTAQNEAGYFVYGRHTPQGFLLEALAPRGLLCGAESFRVEAPRAREYLRHENLTNVEQKKGTSWSARMLGHARRDKTSSAWSEGTRGLVVHTFGGVGGPRGMETFVPGIETGHFSFGSVTRVREPLSDELCMEVIYRQVYAHNHEGIISGASSWETYAGSVTRGWMYLRPLSDLLIDLPLVTTTFSVGGRKVDPLGVLLEELDVMAARYRTGDGTGGAIVTPSSSCVQDSTQALFVALQRFEDRLLRDPSIARLPKNDPGRLRLAQLQRVLTSVEARLLPLGGLRTDWRHAASLSVTKRTEPVSPLLGALRTLLTMRTMLPRFVHDELGDYALQEGAEIVILRTNQIGGVVDGVFPTAPQSLTHR